MLIVLVSRSPAIYCSLSLLFILAFPGLADRIYSQQRALEQKRQMMQIGCFALGALLEKYHSILSEGFQRGI